MKKFLALIAFCGLFSLANAKNLPDFVPEVFLGKETFNKCLLFSLQSHYGEEVEICREARINFYNALEKWIKDAEDNGFINRLEGYELISSDPGHITYAIALIESAQMMNHTKEMFIELEKQNGISTFAVLRTGSPLDLKEQVVKPECPATFVEFSAEGEGFSDYFKLLAKAVRLNLIAREAELQEKKENKMRNRYSFLMIDVASISEKIIKANVVTLATADQYLAEINNLEAEFLEIANGSSDGRSW